MRSFVFASLAAAAARRRVRTEVRLGSSPAAPPAGAGAAPAASAPTARLRRPPRRSAARRRRRGPRRAGAAACAARTAVAGAARRRRHRRRRRRDAGAGDADRVRRPRPRPTRASAWRRAVGRSAGRVEPEAGLDDAAGGEVRSASRNSDLAFIGKYAIQGNYNGFQVYDISNPVKPTLAQTLRLPGVAERRLGLQEPAVRLGRGAPAAASTAASRACPSRSARIALRGIRIFDITDMAHPEVHRRTCRRAAARTRTPSSTDPKRQGQRLHLRVRLGGRALRRRSCRAAPTAPIDDPNTASFRLEVIKVPLAHPETGRNRQLAAHLLRPRAAAARGRASRVATAARAARRRRRGGAALPALPARGWRGRRRPAVRRGAAARRTEPVPRHHRLPGRSASPAARAAATGCCSTFSDVAQPGAHRLGGRHQHVVLALGHVQQRRHEDPLLRRVGRRIAAALPRHRQDGVGRRRALHDREQQDAVQELLQDAGARRPCFENCVAHNGSLIPIPGREVMVQGWYQGGISVFDWTDVSNAEGDRLLRPRPDGRDAARSPPDRGRSTGTTACIVSSEIARGLDVFELLPSGLITQNELDAAKTVKFDYLNAQEQRKIVWPAELRQARAPISISSSARRARGGEDRRGARQAGSAEKLSGSRAAGAQEAGVRDEGRGRWRGRSGEGRDAGRSGQRARVRPDDAGGRHRVAVTQGGA